MKNIFKYLSFGALAVIIVMMIADVFHNTMFILLWTVAAISGIIWLLTGPGSRKFFTIVLHLAFVPILTGALTTYLTGEKGKIHLREGEAEGMFQLENGTVQALPFRLRLDKFSIEYYSGTESTSDYHSTVTVLPDNSSHIISMNHILRHKGYRFYQADFDKDRLGVTLAVNHDPWGIGITYGGYLMLLLSMIGFFFQKGTAFRSALKRIALSSVLLIGICSCAAPDSVQKPKALPEQAATAFGELYVYYNDRVCPLSSLNLEYCLKAYGKASWEDYSADQVITGWFFYYDWWRTVPFKLKKKDKGGTAESEKDYLRRSVASGEAFKVFPIADEDGTVKWYSCNDALPDYVLDNYELWVFVRKALDLVDESVREEDWDEFVRLVGRIKAYQEKTASECIPSQTRVDSERLYNIIWRPRVPFMVSITLGIILFILSGILMAKGEALPKLLQKFTLALLILLWCYLGLVLGLRWYIIGQAPLAGNYCVMMLMAWLSCLCSLLLRNKFTLVLPMGLLIAGFTMLVASLAGANPQITHLMPVLQSPLLGVHVLSMMISYTLFALVALCGIMGILMPSPDAAARLKDVSLVVLYPAVFILSLGIFLGAIWANVSWGSYWSWDPKETWALITMLIYSFALHEGSIEGFRRPTFFHIYCILAFLSVLMTYFGVNLFLGGMHAYS